MGEPPKANNVPCSSNPKPRVKFPNPPEQGNPDPETLRDQRRFAIRQYSKWYSHAWGTAILAGVSFFALGWAIKGSNPISSFNTHTSDDGNDKEAPP
ncbi:hypothetical protein M5689_011669 [Euphorbia peplus]|nr:hypothetical protein M5689_011669 [Euphorbia peplus]